MKIFDYGNDYVLASKFENVNHVDNQVAKGTKENVERPEAAEETETTKESPKVSKKKKK